MREALAAADHDFVLTGPASKLKHLREKVLAVKRRGFRRNTRRSRRYLTIFAASLFAAMAAGILINALVLQRVRHPAPLFARALPAAAAKKPASSEAGGGKPAEADTQKSQALSGTASARKTSVNDPAISPRDQIARLLKEGAVPPARPAAVETAPIAPNKMVLAAQRALVKLGFVLKPDGVAGPATRQAVERYERERGLPVRGELSADILRKLSAEAEIPIN